MCVRVCVRVRICAIHHSPRVELTGVCVCVFFRVSVCLCVCVCVRACVRSRTSTEPTACLSGDSVQLFNVSLFVFSFFFDLLWFVFIVC